MKRLGLLPPCSHCAPLDGLWRVAAGGGLERCTCARGARLAALDLQRRRCCTPPAPPQIDRKSLGAGEREAA